MLKQLLRLKATLLILKHTYFVNVFNLTNVFVNVNINRRRDAISGVTKSRLSVKSTGVFVARASAIYQLK
jgi:hypothetical protein